MVNRVGLSRKHILDAVDASVARLGTYIDVLQIHRLDRATPREEILRALHDVVESGKVRYLGASSMAAWEFQGLVNLQERECVALLEGECVLMDRRNRKGVAQVY